MLDRLTLNTDASFSTLLKPRMLTEAISGDWIYLLKVVGTDQRGLNCMYMNSIPSSSNDRRVFSPSISVTDKRQIRRRLLTYNHMLNRNPGFSLPHNLMSIRARLENYEIIDPKLKLEGENRFKFDLGNENRAFSRPWQTTYAVHSCEWTENQVPLLTFETV